MTSDPVVTPHRNRSKTPAIIASLLLVILGISLTGLRTYKDYAPVSRDFDFHNMGLFDFHNGGYFPALAFRHKVNPYAAEVCEAYPVSRPSPTYSPVVFLTHLPFTYLPVRVADIVCFLFNLSLLGLLAWWAVTMSRPPVLADADPCDAEVQHVVRGLSGSNVWVAWLTFFGLILFSRAGHVTLYTGYFTTQLVVGTVMALHFAKTKPFLSGAGMLLASGKPTYIVPLVFLMAFRKNYKALVVGLALSALVAIGGISWLATDSSYAEVVEGIKHGQDAFYNDINEEPANTWTRLDLIGVIAKIMHWNPDNKAYLACMLGLLVVPCLAIWKTTDNESNHGATGLTAMIASLAILVTIYHHSYDCLLIFIPWIGVTFFPRLACPELSKWQRWAVALLLAIPMYNYASTLKFRSVIGLANRDGAWNAITSINGICLLAALVVFIWVAFSQPEEEQQ